MKQMLTHFIWQDGRETNTASADLSVRIAPWPPGGARTLLSFTQIHDIKSATRPAAGQKALLLCS